MDGPFEGVKGPSEGVICVCEREVAILEHFNNVLEILLSSQNYKFNHLHLIFLMYLYNS